MNKPEFQEWMSDLKAKLPTLGSWVVGLPAETKRQWLARFNGLELADCLAVNSEILDGQIEVPAWDRDHLPRIYRRRCSELAYARQPASVEAEYQSRRRSSGDASRATTGVYAGDRARVEEVLRRMEAWRKANPAETRTPGDLIHAWTEEVFSDVPDDDPARLPRFRCHKCRDSGYVSGERDGVSVQYACECNRGKERCEQWQSNKGRAIARTGGAPTDNQFNDALEGL